MSETDLLIVPDIFGKTDELLDFRRNFESFYRRIDILDPYHGVSVDCADETTAYAAFQQHCGLDALTRLVRDAARCSGQNLDIIGFSVGASAVWAMSDTPEANGIGQAFCFYGSRIRDYLDRRPAFPVDLIFPCKEPHFSVRAVMDCLCGPENVACIQTDYLHGFMNPRSVNFDAEGCREYTERLTAWMSAVK